MIYLVCLTATIVTFFSPLPQQTFLPGMLDQQSSRSMTKHFMTRDHHFKRLLPVFAYKFDFVIAYEGYLLVGRVGVLNVAKFEIF